MKVVKDLTFVEKREGKSPAYHKCGAIFERSDGSLVMRLDMVPHFGEKGKWIEVYDVKNNGF